MKIWLALLLALGCFGALRAQEPATVPARATTIFFVRHAEKDPQGDARDPGLSETGRARAQALARLLEHAGVEHLYASEFQRTQRTLAPLAEKLGKTVEPVPGADAAGLLRRLHELPEGSVSIVAGHSNTVPALVQSLGGKLERLQKGNLGESEFDRLFVLTLPPAALVGKVAPSVVELAYGN